MKITVRKGSHTDKWQEFDRHETTSLKIKDIGEKISYLWIYDSNLSNHSFKAQASETIEDTLFLMDIIERLPKELNLYIFEDQYEPGYSGFRFSGEGQKIKNPIFDMLPCSETIARRIFSGIILNILKEENYPNIFYIKHDSFGEFIIYDNNNNPITEKMEYEKVFKYIEKEG